MDFAPAFATAFLAGVFAVFGFLPSPETRDSVLRYALYLFVGIWWGVELFTARTVFGSPESLTFVGMDNRIPKTVPSARFLPDIYKLNMHFPDDSLPFNGTGWDSETGETNAAVALFVADPDRLELEVAPAKNTKVTLADYEHVQAKIGLELLTLKESKETPMGRLLIFRGPQCKTFKYGTQIAFIGLVAPADLDVGESKLRLLQVRWH
jgi:hypothetical protein